MTRQQSRQPTPGHMRWADTISEAAAAIGHRPGRACLTALGSVIGVAALVAVLGLTATATGQISARFTALAATEVLVADAGTAHPHIDLTPAFPADTDARLLTLHGVVSGGVIENVAAQPVLARPREPGGFTITQAPVYGITPGGLAAMHLHVREGRLYDAWSENPASRTVLVSSTVAQAIGLPPLDGDPVVITVGGVRLAVAGVVDDAERVPEVLQGVIVPRAEARSLWGSQIGPTSSRLIAETRVGAARLVASQIALAVRPDAPGRLAVTPPPDPQELRRHVSDDLGALFLALAAVSVLVGAAGIANTVLVSVMERIPEIGLRRALGARGRHIAVQFLAEGTTLGLLGGLAGTAGGLLCVLATAAVHHWTPVMPPWTVVTAPLTGALAGLVASVYPAWRASRVPPLAALRG